MTLEFAQFGAGRIGKIHAQNVAAHPQAKLRWVVDPNLEAAQQLASKYGAQATTDAKQALADGAVNAVIIASATNTHVDLVTESARAKKAIFCEKPIDNDLKRVDGALVELEKSGVPFFVAFNRRFDPSFAELQSAVRGGAVGKVETVLITSRDPSPPPVSYIKVSGGIFRDMMIHDLDMARWLLGEEPVEVFAQGSCLVDPGIGEAGDVDTAVVVLKTARGALCTISNSRRASYGYDQRIEVFGEKGMLRAENVLPTTVSRYSDAGVQHDKPLHFFLERYEAAYRRELVHFIDAVVSKKAPSVGAKDGRQALVLAEAALESLQKRAPVSVR